MHRSKGMVLWTYVKPGADRGLQGPGLDPIHSVILLYFLGGKANRAPTRPS